MGAIAEARNVIALRVTPLALWLSLLAACSSADSAAPSPDAGAPPSRFVTRVVSFTPGPGAGYGEDQLPGIVEGPPKGAGDHEGSTDVVSLGMGGEIVLGFDVTIEDGPGPDFIVFENAFYIGDDPSRPFADPGEVSVSDDGETWTTFPCDPTNLKGSFCAGWHPVYSNPDNGISPFDVAHAGGDDFDLANVGVAHAKLVRIRDVGMTKTPPTAGFDLDAIAIVNAGSP